MMTPVVSAFQLLDEGMFTSNYHTSFALGTVQVQESGGREASSDQSNTDIPYLMHQHCGYEGQKLYNLSPMSTAPRGNGWMLAGDGYVPVRYLYKPAPVAVLELIKCGCKTSCKGHCSCKKNNLPALLSGNATILFAATSCPDYR